MLVTAPVRSRLLIRMGDRATQCPKKIPEGSRLRHISRSNQRADP